MTVSRVTSDGQREGIGSVTRHIRQLMIPGTGGFTNTFQGQTAFNGVIPTTSLYDDGTPTTWTPLGKIDFVGEGGIVSFTSLFRTNSAATSPTNLGALWQYSTDDTNFTSFSTGIAVGVPHTSLSYTWFTILSTKKNVIYNVRMIAFHVANPGVVTNAVHIIFATGNIAPR